MCVRFILCHLQAFYFDREDVAFPGAHKFFKKSSDEEREHAELLMKFQNQRGGTICLKNIQKPERDSWGTLLDAFKAALSLEKNVNQSLLDIHKLADGHGDAQVKKLNLIKLLLNFMSRL